MLRWAPRGLGILVLILLAFLGIDFGAALRSLWHARPEYLLPGFGLFCLGVCGRMATWVLVASSLKLGYRRVVSYVRIFLVSWFAGLGIPQGASSFTRLAVIAADHRSVGRGMVAVGVERVLQVTVVVTVLLLSSIYLSALTLEALRWLLMGIGILAGVAMALTLTIRLGLSRPLGSRLQSYTWVRTFKEETAAAMTELRSVPVWRMACILGVALLASLVTITALFLSSRALDIHIHYVVLMAAWAAVSLSSLLPISINGLGPREGIMAAAVAGVGLNSEGGVALGLLWFFMQIITRLGAGLAWFTVLHHNREAIRGETQE